jgi:hypothetical protein
MPKHASLPFHFMRDFSKFFFFVKGVIESGTVIKYGDKVLKNDLKLHFNRLMSSSVELERYMHQALGREVSEAEEGVNHMLIEMIWRIFDMDNEELDSFLQHINKYEDKKDE